MIELKTLGYRVRYIKNQLGGTDNFEQLTGVSASQQSRLIRDEIKSPGLFQMAEIAKAGGVTLDWLATGEGEPGGGSSVASGYKALPFLDNEKPPLLFEKNYLVNFLRVPESSAVMHHQQNDSMEPSIPRDSYAVIDTSKRIGDGIYLLTIKGLPGTILRRLQFIPGEGILVKADNENYKSYTLSIDDMNIEGAVAWQGHR